MNKKLAAIAVAGSAMAGLFMASAAYALTPSFTASYTGSGDYVQVNIANADANANVLLDTPTSMQALGTTNANGQFTATISTAAYNITPGVNVYVTVNGQSSPTISWPYTGSSSSFSLSQTSVSVTAGQSVTITANNSGPFYLSSNSSPSVANVSFNGSQITVTGNTAGTTNLAVCLVNNGGYCQTVAVTVSGVGSQSVSFSQNSLTIPTGQSATVYVNGGTGVYMIYNNSNPTSVSASVSGNTVSLVASNVAGSANITVCSTNQSSCNAISVTVGSNTSYSTLVFSNAAPSLTVGQSVSVSIMGGVVPYYVSSNSNSGAVGTAISGNVLTLSGTQNGFANITVCSNSNACATLPVSVGTASSGSLTFGQSNVTLSPGQSNTVAVSGGSGSYYISNNSNGSVASVSVNGANVIVAAVAAGTDNVSVCAANGQCGTIYVTVNGPAASGTTATTGGTLTLTHVLSVGQGMNIMLSGGTAPYTISGNTNSLFSASVNGGNVLTLVGLAVGQSSVTVCSANDLCVPVYVAVTAASGNSGSAGTASAATAQYVFTKFLSIGSTGAAVTALQEQLAKDGFFTGSATGYYGELTAAAVKAFQAAHGIATVGYVGPSTRAALNAGN